MPPARCPICKRVFQSDDTPAMPFCSDRCRLIDLGRWADEAYGLPELPSEDRVEHDQLRPPDDESDP